MSTATGVELHLRPGERIISSFGPYHATSSRVILFLEKDTGDALYELPYSRLEKIEEIRVANHRRMMLGTLITISSFIAAYGLGLITPMIGVVIGIFLVLHGGLGHMLFYQLYGKGMTKEELYRWQIQHRGAGSLIASIRTITGDVER